MYKDHLITRISNLTISLIVIVLAITGMDSYTFPLVGVPITGDKLWTVFAFLQVFFFLKGLLTGALNNVIAPWEKFEEGSLAGRRASELPEYWEFFFNNVPMLVLPVISLIIIAHKLYKMYAF